MSWRVPFGDLKIGPSARKRIAEILDSNWVSEGRLIREFEERFADKFGRRGVRQKLLDALSPFEDRLILYRDASGEIIAPHAFPIVLRDETRDIKPLYDHLEKSGVQVKTLFGSLPTQHAAFKFLGNKEGEFPVAERIGRTGLHFSCMEKDRSARNIFGCNEFMAEEDVGFIADKIGECRKCST